MNGQNPTIHQLNRNLGNAFSDDEGATNRPEALYRGFGNGVVASDLKADGNLRNWHIRHVLKKILKEFRDE